MSGSTVNFDFVKAVELPGDRLTFGNCICYDIARSERSGYYYSLRRTQI